jgi:hypothetical protein
MSSYISDDMISWDRSSNISNVSNYSPNNKIPILDFVTPPNYYSDTEFEESSVLYDQKKNKHKHYYLYQKRFNKLILNINDMNLLDKIKLRYMS